jgi:hypothetical protein
VTVADVDFDFRSTPSNTQLQFVIPAHEDGATAALQLSIAGNVLPMSGLPTGWVAQIENYDAGADLTFVLWTIAAALDKADTTVTPAWTGTSRAAGTLGVSTDTLGLGQIGTVTYDSVLSNTGTAASITPAENDEYPILFGATRDVAATAERYPDLTGVSLAALTDLVTTYTGAADIDAWALHGPGGIAAGATGAVTYGMLGAGLAAPPELPVREGFGTFGTGSANDAGGSIDVAFPAAPTEGWFAVLAATGQPPDVASSTPAVDHQAEDDTGGAVGTSLSIALPSGHVGKTAVFEFAPEGNPGTVTLPVGWTQQVAVTGVVRAYSKQVTQADEDAGTVDVSWTTARIARAQLLVVDADLVGFHSTYQLASAAPTYGPHASPQQTGDAASLHLLTWTTTGATVTSTTDAHTVTNNTLPGGHTNQTAYGTDIPGAAGTNPSGTTTLSGASDSVTNSWIFDPRPENPTNLATPTGWTEQIADIGSGDSPSVYVWTKILDAADVTAGQVTVSPTTPTGEFSGIVGLYSKVDPDAPIHAALITSGPTYSAVTASAAIATSTDNTVEIAVVFGADHGAPSHADSLVTTITLSLANNQAAVLTPAGSALTLFDEDRATAGAGSVRAGTIVNGLANEVNHETVAFVIEPAPQLGSRQASVLITFQPAPDIGPTISWPNPAPVEALTDPDTFSGSAADDEGVTDVDLTITRNSDGLQWNGGSWVAGPVTVAATLGTPGGVTTTWTYTATGAFTIPGGYTVDVAATDNGAPTATNTLTRSFVLPGPTATASIRRAVLGANPSIQVEIIGRPMGYAGNVLIARLPIVATEGGFDRRLDSTSEASCRVDLSNFAARRICGDLADVDTWAPWLRVLWNGEEAWTGPIMFIRFGEDFVYLKANDPSVYWQVRVIGQDYIHEATDLATIFADYHRDVYQQDPWGMDVIARPVGRTGDRKVLATDGMVAWSALSELARTGLDFTVVGRTLLIGGEEVPVAPITTLQDEHFTEPLNVVDDGVLRATDFVVSGGDQITGRASLPETSDAYRRYGLVTGRSQERNIVDELSAGQAAKTRLDFHQDSIRVESPNEVFLNPSAPVDLVELIPGARVDVAAFRTCRPAVGQFRVSRVKCDFRGRVALSFQPLGTVAPA